MPGKVVSRDEWLAARKELLVKEKAATRANDQFKSQLRDFPMVKLDKEYTFTGPNGQVTMKDLFEGRKQLVVLHFMMKPGAEVGCNGCSYQADNLPFSLTHLNFRDTSLVVISRAEYPAIEKFKKRMGWTFPWYSSFGSDFNYDFNASIDEKIAPVMYNFMEKEEIVKKKLPFTSGEAPGLSIFYTDHNEFFHTYSTWARGVEGLLTTYQILDLTPLGRQENGEEGDWEFHDEYDFVKKSAST